MTIAYWCVLAAALMPYLFTAIAKIAGSRFDNRSPREWQSRLTGMPQRAHAAHLNSFEAFPFFAVAVLVAAQLHANQDKVDLLAMIYIGLRLLFGLLYIANQATLRSLVWLGGMVCVVMIFVAGS